MLGWLIRLRAVRAARRALVDRDARDLVARFGDAAYDVARDRVRTARDGRTVDANRPDGHWTKVKLRVADLTGREIGRDAAMRRGGDAKSGR